MVKLAKEPPVISLGDDTGKLLNGGHFRDKGYWASTWLTTQLS
ncbi:hypothetical protein BX257_3316 [Streptomyces sp. 3212.3]|nr:hypothetical protein BX257_3316 [Streptomyces sp. 3212.3]